MRVAASPFLTMLPIAACGDVPIPEDTGPFAPEQCEALLEAICANAAAFCVPPPDLAECLRMFEKKSDCEEADRVSGNYRFCMDDVETSEACLLEVGLPQTCKGVILSEV